MPFAAALSTDARTEQALDEVCAGVQGLTEPDLAVVFFSTDHLNAVEGIARTLNERLRPRALLGCLGESIIGNDREIEGSAALSLWLGHWQDPIGVQSFHLQFERTSEGHSLLGWPDDLVGAVPERSALMVLGDPFSFPTDFFLEQVNSDYSGLRVVGGMSSGMSGPGQTRLIRDTGVHDAGAVGVLLQGELGLRTVVSQGCRPIGRPMVITRAQENVILELGGRPPLEVLKELYPTLTEQEQVLFQQGLHVGRVTTEFRDLFQRGDFLVRNVLGIDRRTGALAITDRVRVGQTVQFHVRDAETADEDLHALLQLDIHAHDRKPAGGLVFSCNGRGSRLFDQPHHDATVVRQEAGPIPLAGFFAAGELGPVGDQNFIHGYTASVALFEE